VEGLWLIFVTVSKEGLLLVSVAALVLEGLLSSAAAVIEASSPPHTQKTEVQPKISHVEKGELVMICGFTNCFGLFFFNSCLIILG
jgi:hypothetical protein